VTVLHVAHKGLCYDGLLVDAHTELPQGKRPVVGALA